MRARVDRLSLDAVIMGLVIGLSAVLLENLAGEASWLVRIIALLVVGLILCAAQYALIRWRRRS
jgi:hypothetical protein